MKTLITLIQRRRLMLIVGLSCALFFSTSQAANLTHSGDEGSINSPGYRVLSFQGDNGFVHPSKEDAERLLEQLGETNDWQVTSTSNADIFSLDTLLSFDVVVFNNNCGNAGRILSDTQQQAFQQYIRKGGGFVGIHCAGALWHEEGNFQRWYEQLIGTRLVDHPPVQTAKLVVENTQHISTKHLPEEWSVRDEWHRFAHNPRQNVQVLLSLDEDSYQGEQKMGGDHPFTWYQYFDGGRSFFTSLGHTKEIYADKGFQRLVEGAVLWAAGGSSEPEQTLPVTDGILLDLDADHLVQLEDGNRVSALGNKVKDSEARDFVKQDEGRVVPGSGRPILHLNVPELNGHNSLVFHQGELVCFNEDAFDSLTQGKGYTWFSVMSVYQQRVGIVDVNSFFGNLRNTNLDRKGRFEGFWGGVTDDNRAWMGSRNAITQGRWDHNNPYVLAPKPLETAKYYVVAGRMEAGVGKVNTQLFINTLEPVAEDVFPVNPEANPSKMVIGQERDATNHPGKESFDGEIARFLIFERPLSNAEMSQMIAHLSLFYGID